MKIAFFFDTVLLKDEKNDYYGMTLTYDFFKARYLEMFDEIVVATRVKDKSKEQGNISGYRITNGENVEVNPITKYRDIPDAIKKYKEINKQVENIVKNVDKVIIRMPSIIGMFACNSAKKLKKKYLIEMVACPWDGYLNHVRFGGKILAPIITILTKKYVKEAPNVLYVTNEFLQKRYPTKGNKIACSDVVLNELNDEILEKRLEKIDNMKDEDIIKLGTVASVGLKYKGQEYVMRAIAELKKTGKIYEYYLAGGGDNTRLKIMAKELGIEKEIHFLGSLPHDQVFKLLDDIDIYVQPSLQEGLPRALLEAMSRACPAIGSDVGGIPELLNTDMIFKRKNKNQLLNILNLLNRDMLKRCVKENYNEIKKYESTTLFEKRKKFYTSI